MSWLFIESGPESLRNAALPAATPLLHSVSTPFHTIAIGGIPETSHIECNPETKSGWAVVGVGIIVSGAESRIMSRDDWREALSAKAFDAASLDGQFVAIRWKGGELQCFTDQLGCRALYYGGSAEGVVLSTRLDMVARALRRSDPDPASLGERWLLCNEFSLSSCVAGIDRLGPGARLIIRDGVLSARRSTPWVPPAEPVSFDAALEVLKTILSCASGGKRSVSLALSGGVDSRLLLAILSRMDLKGLSTFSFGDGADPDVRLAGEISAALGISHRHLDAPLPDPGACIDGMREYAGWTMLVEPATSFARLRYYPRLYGDGVTMVDGGFGEIARRRYFRRLETSARAALHGRDYAGVFPQIRSRRPNIFSQEALRLMECSASRGVQSVLAEMPSADSVGIGNFLDLLAIRTRIPNYGGFEQARNDAEILNIVPFAQPSFLRAMFGIPVEDRAKGALHARLIRESVPALARFPLAKAGVTVPFGLSSNASSLVARAKGAFRYVDPAPVQILRHVREYVLDRVHSQEVVNDALLDYPRILKETTAFYAGKSSLALEVDWWLTFDLWRQGLASPPRIG